MFIMRRGVHMKRIDIIKKLIGEVEPYGDTNIDRERYDNLNMLGELTVDMVYMIGEVSKQKEHYAHSVSIMGKLAYEDLIVIKEYIETIID